MLIRSLLLISFLTLSGCVKVPNDIKPVSGFEINRYLGQWYEIARLDHSFERGLSHVSAQYNLRDDGGIEVINRGYLDSQNSWKEARGKAYFAKSSDLGFLKVSFFGPFFGSYVIFDLDTENYQYALVCGPDRSYLWLLARTPTLDKEITDRLTAKAAASGFATDNLIFVQQQ